MAYREGVMAIWKDPPVFGTCTAGSIRICHDAADNNPLVCLAERFKGYLHLAKPVSVNRFDCVLKQFLEKRVISVHETHVACFVQFLA